MHKNGCQCFTIRFLGRFLRPCFGGSCGRMITYIVETTLIL
uniref:Uncharacterized protein n=1 Tax=Ackermannviridae sp. TaxID=2831612 RepID=A0A8S5RTP1_9CAUD|nr:MAG TPA: hypothetical protein [Ackermannviridae sp.]